MHRHDTRVLRAALLVAVAGFVFGVVVPVAHAGLAKGAWTYYTAGNIGYRNQASVLTNSDGASAWTYVETYNPERNVAAGYMGVLERLYKHTGVLVFTSSWDYNDSICAGMNNRTSFTTVRDSYYSRGSTRGWNGSGYNTYYTFRSPNQTY